MLSDDAISLLSQEIEFVHTETKHHTPFTMDYDCLRIYDEVSITYFSLECSFKY